ncbi:RNA polymerase sigma-70 factor [Draconibacterium sp. IB214405]|uniref:RNA polymerase sigma-70 factor n=1 Tax=Draconibacterium sp. IB214405 TaxID=3097352 RepID=UPI002A0C2160|nr:RNA polymerase sigma-70 factor [Draconibacterium sp. IB214405]MDX8340681.1 RNA polymerase sigma-70 factor [Draconibacterium sp. IB214405]
MSRKKTGMPESEIQNINFLLAELARGQERAFDFIFRKYYKALCAQANVYVKDIDTAQGIVQESFIKLWGKREEAESIKNLPSYLTSMVRNQCIDYMRKVNVLNKTHQQGALTGDAENTTENLVLAHEFEEKLVVALANLPERCRIAFEYSRFENLKYPEIAEKMGISVKAVEALISRALKTLRTDLKDYLPFLLLLFKMY